MTLRGAVAHTTPWSAEDRATLASVYPLAGAKAAAKAVGRPVGPVMKRAMRMGLSRKRRWTTADDMQLRSLWGELSIPQIAKTIGRTVLATHWRSRQLMLEAGAPQGTEYLSDAADRCGYDTTTLRRILAWHGVKLRRSMSRPTGAKRCYHVVDPFDCDEAVAAWVRSEDLAQGAARHGLIPDVLGWWLDKARGQGFDVPARPRGHKCRWRLPMALVDAVVAWRSGHETLAAAARRTGVHWQRLGRMLGAAGVPRWSVKPWFVKRGDVDRVLREGRA